jgi:GDPmannose 4,6-dehydratase
MIKTYLFTGITSQLGQMLTKVLSRVADSYIIGLCRKESMGRAKEMFSAYNNVILVSAEKGEKTLVKGLLSLYRPDIVGHLAARSSVFESNQAPLQYFESNVEYTLSILDSIRAVYSSVYRPKFFNMSSTEIFGSSIGTLIEKRNEDTPINPSNMYGASKAAAHVYVDTYRSIYGIYANNIITANFTSEFQSSSFVASKIINYLLGDKKEKLNLGNISSIRDWSYAEDIVGAILTSLTPETSGNYCVASGNINTVEEFVQMAFNRFGINDYKNYINIENKLIRIGDTNFVNIDCAKLKALGWLPTCNTEQLINKIIKNKKVSSDNNHS